MRIYHNLMSLNAQNKQKKKAGALGKQLEKLASGLAINRAADDAAGLSISESLRGLLARVDASSENVQNAISLIQTADGALQEVHDILHRMKELAVESSDGIFDDEVDRNALQAEFEQLQGEITNIGENAKFNNKAMFKAESTSSNFEFHRVLASYGLKIDLNTQTCEAQLEDTNSDTSAVSTSSGGASYTELEDKIVNEYFPNVISQIFNAFPALKDAVGSDTIDMKLQLGYIDGENNTLAFAAYSCMSTPESRPLSMYIKVDTADFQMQLLAVQMKKC